MERLKLNLIYEAMVLLNNCTAKKNYYQDSCQALKKSGYCPQTYLDGLSSLQRMADEVMERVDSLSDSVRLLFHPLADQNFVNYSFAGILFSCFGNIRQTEVSSFVNAIASGFQEKPGAFFHLAASPGPEFLEHQAEPVRPDMPSILKSLEESNLTPEDQLLALKIFSAPEKYLASFEEILSLALSALGPHEKELLALSNSFWEEFSSEKLEEWLQKNGFFNFLQKPAAEHSIYASPLGFNAFFSQDHPERSHLFCGIYILQIFSSLHQDLPESALMQTLKLLGDPSKFEILKRLSKRQVYAAQLAKDLDLSTATISYHMQALLNAGLVTMEKENGRSYYHFQEDFFRHVLTSLENAFCTSGS